MKARDILICEDCGVGVKLMRGEKQECPHCRGPLTVHKAKQSKYRNVRVEVDGYQFDSKKEAARYGELKLLLQSGAIANLDIHPRYKLIVSGIEVGVYVGDFEYIDVAREVLVVEDVKSSATKTKIYKLKKKLMLALWEIEIMEV